MRTVRTKAASYRALRRCCGDDPVRALIGAAVSIRFGAVYPNFPDPDLENWPRAYYGANDERLVRVKEAYDPDGWFRYPQSIGSDMGSG